MNDQLITLETAKLAKEKDFNFYTIHSYWEDKITAMTPSYPLEDGTHADYERYLTFPRYLAPSQSLLQRWLREIHNIHVWLIPAVVDKTYRAYIGYGIKLDLLDSSFTDSFITYEEALEDGLYQALRLIKI